MFTKVFWKDAAERAVKAFGASAASAYVAGATLASMVAGLQAAVVTGLGTAVGSILLSLASLRAGNSGTASAVKEVKYEGTPDAL